MLTRRDPLDWELDLEMRLIRRVPAEVSRQVYSHQRWDREAANFRGCVATLIVDARYNNPRFI